MLNVYRRHGLNCKHRDRNFALPMQLVDRRPLRQALHKSLHTEIGNGPGMVQDIEAAGTLPEEKVTTQSACDSFIRDAETRESKKATIANTNSCSSDFEIGRHRGIKHIADLRWRIAAISQRLGVSQLRAPQSDGEIARLFTSPRQRMGHIERRKKLKAPKTSSRGSSFSTTRRTR